MDLKELSKLDIKDLKNIDISEIRDWIQNKPYVLINILLIGLTIFAVTQIFTKYKDLTSALKKEVAELEEKLEAVNETKRLAKEMENFKKNTVQSIQRDKFSDTISEFAIKNRVEILSYSPAQEKNDKFINLISINIKVRSHDYNNLIKFIKTIESSPYSVRVDTWSVGQQSSSRRRRGSRQSNGVDTDEDTIEAQISVSNIEFNF